MQITKPSSSSPQVQQSKETRAPETAKPAQPEVSQPQVEQPSQVAQEYNTDRFASQNRANPVAQSLSPANTEEQTPATTGTEAQRRSRTDRQAPHVGDLVTDLLNRRGAQGATPAVAGAQDAALAENAVPAVGGAQDAALAENAVPAVGGAQGADPAAAVEMQAQAQGAAAAAAVDPHGRAVEATSGAEAAARLQDQSNYTGAEWEQQRGADYLGTVEAHQDDPAFMQDMYEGLGPELSAHLMDQATRVLPTDSEAEAQGALQTVAESLNHMPESFQREVGVAAGQNNPGASLVLANGASQAAKLGFLEGVREQATGEGAEAGTAARMAGQVIASDPALLRHVADTWSSDDVSKLLNNGLATPPPPGAFPSDWESFRSDGLDRMVGMTADLTGPEYADFRAGVFGDASMALEHSRAGDPNRQQLVDNLKTLFQSDSAGIVNKLFNNAEGSTSYDGEAKAMSLFFRDALFANPNPDDPFTQHVSGLMSDLREQMLTPPAEDTPSAAGINGLRASEAGDVLGSLAAGYTRAVQQNGEDQAAREALIGTALGMLTSPVKVGGGPVGGALKDAVVGIGNDILTDFINGDLQAEQEDMDALVQALQDQASVGARDFDTLHGTSLETKFRSEALWIALSPELFGR